MAVLLFLLRPCGVCYLSPLILAVFVFSTDVQESIPAPARTYGQLTQTCTLQHPPLTVGTDLLTCDTHALSPLPRPPIAIRSVSVHAIWLFGLNGKTIWSPASSQGWVWFSLTGTPGVSVQKHLINPREQFCWLLRSAPRCPSCKINKWTVDFSGVSVSYLLEYHVFIQGHSVDFILKLLTSAQHTASDIWLHLLGKRCFGKFVHLYNGTVSCFWMLCREWVSKWYENLLKIKLTGSACPSYFIIHQLPSTCFCVNLNRHFAFISLTLSLLVAQGDAEAVSLRRSLRYLSV